MSPPLDDFDPVPTTTVTTTTTATSANTTISPVTTPTPVTATASPAAALRQDEVDAIIRSKRKARQPKACYPCHARKVRCDRQLPCTGCVRRDHAELCSYERPSSRRRAGVVPGVEGQLAEAGTPAAVAGVSPGAVPIGSSSSDAAAVGGNVVMIATDEWLRICERLRAADERDRRDRQQFGEVEDGGVVDGNPGHQQTLDDGFDPANDQSNMNRAAPGVYAPNEFGGGTVHLGSRSVLAYILANPSLSRDAAATLAEGGILPKLGLDNESATYPFVDLWSSDPATFDVDAVCAALPEDELCRTYMQKYRDITSSIYPVLSDINHFETSVELLLRNRAAFPRVQPDRPFGMSLEFIGLFFAILSAGCLATSDPGKHITSQVYICCSYQFLRVNNYLSQPSIEAIQTLLIIGSVLSYNMNPGVSYVVFGMTLRMGLVLGLHVESSQFPPMEQYVRRCLWWSMAWQESHFSLSYDRPTVMAFSQPDIPYGPGSAPGNRSYFETLCQLMSITLEIVRARMLAPPQHTAPAQLASIQRYEDRVSRILADTTVHLRDSRACTFLSQHLEHLALKLHSSYLLSELYRPVLKPDHGGMATASAFSDPREAAELQEKCIDALAATVQAYVDLHSVEPAAAISWVAMQRAISSAFLLAVCVNPRNTERYIPGLLRQLEMVMAARASAEGVGLEGSDGSGADDMTWQPQSQWTKPLTKSLRTLRKLNSVLDAQIRINGSGRDRSERSTPNPGSAFHSFNPTPTMSPDSSSSSDWTMPKLMDRVSEYIHPPLW